MNKKETKAMTGSEHEKAGIVPPLASAAANPANRKPRSVSLKPTSHKTCKTTGPTQTPKTVSTMQQTEIADPKQTPKIEVLVAMDTILDRQDPKHQPGSVVLVHKAAGHSQGADSNQALQS